MNVIEVTPYQQGNEFFMKVTKFPAGHTPVSAHHQMHVENQAELQQVVREYQATLQHFGNRVIILKGEE